MSYTYPGSPLHNGSIRLIKLLPGPWASPIRCKLYVTDLSPSENYSALSYVWGSQAVTRPIFLNDQTIAATCNLEGALRHLREQNPDGIILWVDALCINQQDIKERMSQVRMMGKIYAACQRTIVYLGDGLRHKTAKTVDQVIAFFVKRFMFDDTDVPFSEDVEDTIEESKINIAARRSGHFDTVKMFSFIRRSASDEHLSLFLVKNKADATSKELQMRLFEMLRRLMNPPWPAWWTRIWVLQEVVMPRDVLIICGNAIAPWDMFVHAAGFFHQHTSSCCSSTVALLPRDQYQVLQDFYNKVPGTNTLRLEQDYQGANALTLLDLLRRFRHRRATDPRDKVYALLSLAKDAHELELYPDYSKDTQEVFTRTTFAIIKKYRTLEILHTEIRRKFRTDLPTWVPNWDAPGVYTDGDRSRMDALYNATNCFRYLQEQALCWGKLHIQARFLDRVIPKSISRAVMLGESAIVVQKTIAAWCEFMYEKGNSNFWRIGKPFWRVICGDMITEDEQQRRMREEDEMTFVSWWNDSARSPRHSLPKSDYYCDISTFVSDGPTHSSIIVDKFLRQTLSNAALARALLLRYRLVGYEIVNCFRPSDGPNKTSVAAKVMELLSIPPRKDMSWAAFQTETENELLVNFQTQSIINLDEFKRKERVKAMDASILSATLSRCFSSWIINQDLVRLR